MGISVAASVSVHMSIRVSISTATPDWLEELELSLLLGVPVNVST